MYFNSESIMIVKVKMKRKIKGKMQIVRLDPDNGIYEGTVAVIIDVETGVNYFQIGDTVIPRYNKDGSLFITTKNQIPQIKNSFEQNFVQKNMKTYI